jgi:diguanylate cyclase (GGDEF)-like protein
MSDLMLNNEYNNKVNRLELELDELNKLYELISIINSSSGAYSFCEKFVSYIKKCLKSNIVSVFVNDSGRFRLFASTNNLSPSSLLSFENQGEGIWNFIEENKSFCIEDENNRNIFNDFFESYGLLELQSKIWLPLQHENKIIGVVSLSRKENNENFTEEESLFLSKIAQEASAVISKYNEQKSKEDSLNKLQRSLHNISILYNIGQTMNFIDDLKRLLKLILGKAIETIRAEKGSLMLYDETNEELAVKVVFGLPDKETEEKINDGLMECTTIKIHEGIAGEALVSKKALITNLGSDDPKFKQSILSRVLSILCVPLIANGEAIGVINITNKLGGELFNQDDMDFMVALANQAAIAINNARLYELATKDGLTKLYLYRHFYYLLDHEIKRADRYEHQVSLLMMDIDNFKDINDTYGHQVGDQMLREIANVISSTCRKIDFPSRYGGEEFSVILPETPKDNAVIIAERLRKRIENIVVRGKDNQAVSTTISIGIASYPSDSSDLKGLIEKADEALYFAKKQGKDCTAQFMENGSYIIR